MNAAIQRAEALGERRTPIVRLIGEFNLGQVCPPPCIKIKGPLTVEGIGDPTGPVVIAAQTVLQGGGAVPVEIRQESGGEVIVRNISFRGARVGVMTITNIDDTVCTGEHVP